jgi:DNA-binding SARP family transcriptional activator
MHQAGSGTHLTLLGGFGVNCGGQRVQLPLGARRLLALLALRTTGISRGAAAEELWPGSRRGRAAANLRSALSAVKKIGQDAAIEEFGAHFNLSQSVEVDVHVIAGEAQAIMAGSGDYSDGIDRARLIKMLARELLPEWYDDWIIMERERWDELRLHALETLARQLMDGEKCLGALEAALTAAAIDPIRESTHRIIMEIYIAEGNGGCALKHYQHYRRLLQQELGATPSRRMHQLLDDLQSV